MADRGWGSAPLPAYPVRQLPRRADRPRSPRSIRRAVQTRTGAELTPPLADCEPSANPRNSRLRHYTQQLAVTSPLIRWIGPMRPSRRPLRGLLRACESFAQFCSIKRLQQVVVVLLRGADDWSEGSWSVSGNSELFEELPEQPVPEAPGRGTPRLRQPERHQLGWQVVSIDDLVARDHPVRAVWAFVEGLDLRALHDAVKGRG